MDSQAFIAAHPIISLRTTLRLLDAHRASHAEFYADCGFARPEYSSRTVIEWLGY